MGVGIVADIVKYEIIKWVAAVIIAPETFGASIPAAAALP